MDWKKECKENGFGVISLVLGLASPAAILVAILGLRWLAEASTIGKAIVQSQYALVALLFAPVFGIVCAMFSFSGKEPKTKYGLAGLLISAFFLLIMALSII